jgi:zinc transport system substrate-binding protein
MTVMNARRTSSGRPSGRSSRRPLIRTAAPALAAVLGLLPLTACGGEAGADDGRVDVVASFYPMEFLAEEIGGEHVDVTPLTSPGVEPHDLELTPKQVGQLGDADLVVYLKGLQPAVDEAVEQTEVEHVAEATSYTSLEKHGGHEGHDHGVERGGEEHGHEEGGGHEGHDHATEGGGDPHVWLDPVRYAEVAEGVGKQLAKADPSHEKAYRENTERLVDRLATLDGEFRTGLQDRKTDTFVTTHAAFGYLADRYGLHEESISGVDPASGSISAAHIKNLHEIVKEDDVSTVFFPSRASDEAAETLAQDLGLRTGVLSSLETVDDSGDQDYFSVMHQNLQALRTALDAQ